MNGVHDMGGMHGMGPVEIEVDEPVFHHAWERRVLALTVAAGYLGRWNLDMSRHAREQMPPADYLAATYYERWLWGLERLLEQSGLIQPGELDERLRAGGASHAHADPGHPPAAPHAGARVLRADSVLSVLRGAGGARLADDVPPRFRPGDRIRTRTIQPIGHTRLPRYARGRLGTIDSDHGVWIFPDANAERRASPPQHLYGVVFAARELWGPEAPPRDSVYLDLWDDYLDPAEAIA
jgi:nitrile hydratase subunit beta